MSHENTKKVARMICNCKNGLPCTCEICFACLEESCVKLSAVREGEVLTITISDT